MHKQASYFLKQGNRIGLQEQKIFICCCADAQVNTKMLLTFCQVKFFDLIDI